MKVLRRAIAIVALIGAFLPALLFGGRLFAVAEEAPEQYHLVKPGDGSDEVLYSFYMEEGVAGWNFDAKDLSSKASSFDLDGGYEVHRAYEFTILPIEGERETPNVTVRIRLEDGLAGEELLLFKLDKEGPVRVDAAVEEGYLVFTENDFLETTYIVATESNFPLYLTLSLLFGLACVVGAAVFLVYLKKHKNAA